ncbi:hypothetical protein GCM10011504_59000 [Siccirubricoccus deserti]|nr:hypothetical protein GCM10011504_59000 [Siccirubricoccus deserti]
MGRTAVLRWGLRLGSWVGLAVPKWLTWRRSTSGAALRLAAAVSADAKTRWAETAISGGRL